MSETTTTATVESAPTSTTDAAAQVLDAFEQTETTGAEISSEATPAAETTPAPTTPETPIPVPGVVEKPLSDAEQLLHDAGYKSAKKPDGRDNYIPHSKVVKIIENGLNQGKGQFGAKYAALETEAQTLREYLTEVRADVTGDPKAFLTKLAAADPRYRAFLDPPAAQTPAPAADAEMPAPDLALGDGSRTYSLEGLQKLLEWNTRRVEAKVEERLKPLAEREKQAEQRAKEQEFQSTLQATTQKQLQDAQTWPMFGALAADGALTPFQQEVLTELSQDSATAKAAGRRPTMSLRQAYLEVENRYKSADYNAVYERALKNINGAPRSTAVARTGGEAPRANGTRTTADIAAGTLARLERSGGA